MERMSTERERMRERERERDGVREMDRDGRPRNVHRERAGD